MNKLKMKRGLWVKLILRRCFILLLERNKTKTKSWYSTCSCLWYKLNQILKMKMTKSTSIVFPLGNWVLSLTSTIMFLFISKQSGTKTKAAKICLSSWVASTSQSATLRSILKNWLIKKKKTLKKSERSFRR